jgi:hypothetical protein
VFGDDVKPMQGRPAGFVSHFVQDLLILFLKPATFSDFFSGFVVTFTFCKVGETKTTLRFDRL